MRIAPIITLAIAGILLVPMGCTRVHVHREVIVEDGPGASGGPPDWAPAHGYRRKQGEECRHDSHVYCDYCRDKKGRKYKKPGKGPKK